MKKKHIYLQVLKYWEGLPYGTSGKEPDCQGRIRNTGSICGLGRSFGGGHDNPLQYCLDNPMDRGVWQATVHRIAQSQETIEVT